LRVGHLFFFSFLGDSGQRFLELGEELSIFFSSSNAFLDYARGVRRYGFGDICGCGIWFRNVCVVRLRTSTRSRLSYTDLRVGLSVYTQRGSPLY
jgi:hypothetical protein